MAENLAKWPSKRGPVTKIMPSDGCGRDAVPLAVERRYDFPEFGGYPGNVGLGTDTVIEHMAASIPDADQGFTLIFSDNPFPQYQLELEWRP